MRKNGASAAAASPSAAFDRGDAVVDLLPGALDRHLVHGERMVLAVGADGVAGVAELADAFRIGSRHLADHEEGRLHALRRRGCPGSGCCCGGSGPSSNVSTTS